MAQSGDELEFGIEKPIQTIVYDPYSWPNVLSDFFREKVVKSGFPSIPNQHTTYTIVGRSFNENIYHAKHINGTHYKRDWLVYLETLSNTVMLSSYGLILACDWNQIKQLMHTNRGC